MVSSGDYDADFQKLGLGPTDNWLEVKSAYRKLARKWHPDRFTESAAEEEKAEEKIKDINQAYNRLYKYYKKHNRLPPKERETSSRPPENKQSHRTPHVEKSDTKAQQKTSSQQTGIYSRQLKVNNQPWKSGKIIFVIIIFISLFLFLRDDNSKISLQTNKKLSKTERLSNQSLAKIPRPPQARSPQESVIYFTYGSTLGKVHAVQGEPTKIEGDIWYYGKSTVRFKKGRVVNWVIDPDSPLKASAIEITKKKLFSYGSTTSDVLSAQGQPSLMTLNFWEYGPSKVYFKNGVVIRWYSSPANPLKIDK